MRYRVVMALIGASVMMAAVTGCSSSRNGENEMDTWSISDMEVLTEAESDFALQIETMTVDLEGTDEDIDGAVSEDTDGVIDENEPEIATEIETELPGLETRTADALKAGAEEDDEAEEAETQEGGQPETDKAEQNKKNSNTKSTEKPETETEPEVTGAESEPEEALREETETESEPEETETEEALSEETEPESEPEETETESETEEALSEETEPENEPEKTPELFAFAATTRVNVRQSPSTDSEVLTLLTAGQQVVAYAADTEAEWTEVLYKSDAGFAVGYIKSEYLEAVSYVYKPTETVNVRAEATTDSDKLGKLRVNQTIEVEAQLENGWSEVLYTVDGEEVTAYIKSEYLSVSDAALTAEQLLEEAKNYLTETGEEPEAVTEAEAKTGTEAGEAAEPESGTEAEAKTGTEAGEAAEPESGTEAEVKPGTEAGEAAEPEAGTETETESGSETETEQIQLADGAESQFELAAELFSDIQKAGIIYSAENADAKTQIEAYEAFAETYGIELVSSEIEEEIDIDLAASQLVGQVDCIFCLDDPVVNDLVQTVCAYADEVGIPVIGILKEQAEQGCLAAYEDGELYWNTEAARKLDLMTDAAARFDGLTVLD